MAQISPVGMCHRKNKSMINTASKLVLGIIGVLIILWWFRYDYITAGQGFIFRVDRFTQTTSVADVSDKEWESIEERPPKPASPAETPSASEFLDAEPASPADVN